MKRHTNTLLQHALVADTICTLCSVLAALDLASEPNTGANGVHASAGPLEGLRERMVRKYTVDCALTAVLAATARVSSALVLDKRNSRGIRWHWLVTAAVCAHVWWSLCRCGWERRARRIRSARCDCMHASPHTTAVPAEMDRLGRSARSPCNALKCKE